MTGSPPRLLHPLTAPRRSSSCVLKQPLLAARGDRLLDASEGPRCLLLLRVRRVELREDVFRVAFRVDLLPDLFDPAIRPDPERRPRHAPVALPVIVLLLPDAVHLSNVGSRIGEQREIQLVLAAELIVAFQRVG